MMANFYLLHRTHAWAAVCISKNACTALKKCILDSENIVLSKKEAIHNRIGYNADSAYLHPVPSGKPDGYFTFAVWRDPLQRFLSAYRHFALEGYSGRLRNLPGSLDSWLEFAKEELSKPVHVQDEHIRRQCDYYQPDDVDEIVGIDRLSEFFYEHGWGEVPTTNRGKALETGATPAQIQTILELYAADYALLEKIPSQWRPPKPVVTSLWVGNSLPPLAELCIRSYQNHGFHFRLMVYEDLSGLPEGTELADASAILPRPEIYTHPTGSLAPFADWWRYRWLASQGGMWTDMDVACLRPFNFGDYPWYASAKEGRVAIGVLNFPAGHAVPGLLELLAEDPATPMPWDTDDARTEKKSLATRHGCVKQRRLRSQWGHAGPHEFTRALKYFGKDGSAAAFHSVYPIPYGYWRHCYDGTRNLDEPLFRDALAIHLWGEMLRREPDACHNRSESGIVSMLLEKHHCRLNEEPALRQNPVPVDQAKILVAVCSCRKYPEKRQAVRETWMSLKADGIQAVFFVGDGDGYLSDEPDTLAVPAMDSYPRLPEKVRAMFAKTLELHEFDWLFKCDDDTYVALDRLRSLITNDADLIGNEFITSRGSPSGGAGYLLSRKLVALLAKDSSIPNEGDEDVLIGNAAIRLGARALSTKRLCWDTSRYPRHDNDVVTSHWCSPDRLQAIHSILGQEVVEMVEAAHPFWSDTIRFYESGVFARSSSACMGTWTEQGDDSRILRWFDWDEELLVNITRTEDPHKWSGQILDKGSSSKMPG